MCAITVRSLIKKALTKCSIVECNTYTYRIRAYSTPAVYKNLRVFGGGLLKFFGFLPQKALKSGLLRQKSGGLFKFGCSGGLIKSGVL